MGVSGEARIMRSQVLVDWGDELPGLPLNYFADELPAAYLRDQTGRSPGDFSVLRRCEIRAKIRRGCWAGALSAARDVIAADTPYAGDGAGWFSSQLPSAFYARYDRDFHRQMLALTISLWDRMEAGTFTGPWCTAEEILLGYVLGQYAGWLGSAELEPGCVDLDGLWLQDDDYRLLYNSEIAENEHVLKALAEQLFTLNLDFASWFKPFNKAYKIPRPTSEAALRRINGG
jgi:hypothetical protein